ncbi:aminomethyl-transferring glycine dehydrogenase [Orrella sp. 11846]|uniref:aminomethyl-transferring glycine dehydrogenase n=1 Tax=Orrella sp. 11846 TaxID=3409913 RepID=UPI003B5C0C39
MNQLHEYAPFVKRHIGPSETEQKQMLNALGVDSLQALMAQVVPEQIRMTTSLDLPEPLDEPAMLAHMQQLADRNQVFRHYIGQGYYGTHMPNVVLRNVLENPAWYTAYTPYQAEISQGRLEAILNFQTMVAELTGMEIANASLLDEATACAEGMGMAWRMTGQKRSTFLVSEHCHPQTIEVLRTRAKGLGITLVVADDAQLMQADVDCFGVLLQYPHSLGRVCDDRALVESLKARDIAVVCATDLLALNLLTPPGHWGVDIVVGSAQRFGVPLGYGGPHAAFMACRDAHKRHMPGRLVGVSRDATGAPALRLALQTREQHIRREKATSNICTAQVLLAVLAGLYAVWHGPQGLKAIATRVHAFTARLHHALTSLGFEVVNSSYFDTLHIHTGEQTERLRALALKQGINLRYVDAAHVAISLDETVTQADWTQLCALFETLANTQAKQSGDTLDSAIPVALRREGAALTHPIFERICSETDMLRYLRRLADMDLALDRTMIPLGSCTMKLNATVEMIPITWPQFANIHPFAPAEQVQGYAALIEGLSRDLCEITGYDAISLQPNSGAQGEYAGLLAIRAFHEANGQSERNICLIPSSAHGTNPASAHMVGMDVMVVQADAQGNVDVEDLKRCIERADERLGALMITYPSTHGVFEQSIDTICALIHDAGGQVYLDGANMNAMVGLARPGKFGADVSHLNLHKTFCIPHGGGGPGIGPVAVRAHLAPYLPGVVSEQGWCQKSQAVGPVSAAPFGSASILPISYAYIRLMGAQGLRSASEIAVLNANYLAARLGEHYPVLYTGQSGRVAHECILDIRPIKAQTGIDAQDVAKRLMDFGFHAPTMSFPVPDTLMVEPTESENLAELERFIEAMVTIRQEIRAVEAGEVSLEDSIVRQAPHTASMLLTSEWTRPYSREEAAFPVASLRANKYWPPVARIDNAWGDRNLICTCPPLQDDFEEIRS